MGLVPSYLKATTESTPSAALPGSYDRLAAALTPTLQVVMNMVPLPTRSLGTTGRIVTTFGLGGEGVLRTWGEHAAAQAVISAAIARGVTYFDSAHAYAGSEDYYGSVWAHHPEAREGVFITSKSAARDAAGARRDLAETLSRLRVPFIDLWQIHDVREDRDIDLIQRKGGALEAFIEAKAAGKALHLGVTGHRDALILLRAVRELPVETVLLPVSIPEGALGGFTTEVIAEARRRKMGVIGMKVLGQGVLLQAGFLARDLLRYALAQDVDTLIIGCHTPDEVNENAKVAAEAPPMSHEEQEALLERARPRARELTYYRSR